MDYFPLTIWYEVHAAKGCERLWKIILCQNLLNCIRISPMKLSKPMLSQMMRSDNYFLMTHQRWTIIYRLLKELKWYQFYYGIMLFRMHILTIFMCIALLELGTYLLSKCKLYILKYKVIATWSWTKLRYYIKSATKIRWHIRKCLSS